MKQSQLFCKTLKENPKEGDVLSHKLLLRGDFISQLASGVYSFLPMGLKAHRNIEKIIRQEIEKIGGQEVLLPSLQPKEIWLKTNRWNEMDPPLFRVKDRHDKEFALGPTHEEVITDLAKSVIKSYKDLPVALYQIQTKFRNEMRFSGGLMRAREFAMKDLYSFHTDKDDLEKFFNKAIGAYENIFSRCGLRAIKSEASGGIFTKEKTYEFQILSEVGEDRILFCPACSWASNLEVAEVKEGDKCPQCKKEKLEKRNSIEAGHIFRLGSKYSEAMGLYYKDKEGKEKPVIMGCYGIGIGRLLATIVEINNDESGIIWPKEIAPFPIHLIQIGEGQDVKKSAEEVYEVLTKSGLDTLYDDRQNKTAGEKFAEADLLGMPWRIVVSERTIKEGSFEVKERNEKETKLVKIENLQQYLNV
jgi:prolyl-tRNA synthetase